ncbi:MAG: hypothetical protein BWY68_00557 [bacterium ADurb.Bin400]|nr:MAG: hypothetical protein BWY68_00557 [bacterium ADurb.Bin400]
MNKIITIETTNQREIVDITDTINHEIIGGEGLCHLFLLHTTAALTTADLDPGTDLDILDAFSRMVPKLKYRHPHDPGHAWSHIMSSLVGTSLLLPYQGGALILGTWQRLVLIELDGPKERQIIITTFRGI